jgi:hypothetical protein
MDGAKVILGGKYEFGFSSRIYTSNTTVRYTIKEVCVPMRRGGRGERLGSTGN